MGGPLTDVELEYWLRVFYLSLVPLSLFLAFLGLFLSAIWKNEYWFDSWD